MQPKGESSSHYSGAAHLSFVSVFENKEFALKRKKEIQIVLCPERDETRCKEWCCNKHRSPSSPHDNKPCLI
jgi:hypothetical protein